MDVQFEPINIRYDGLDASNNQIDLGQLSASLQGAAKVLGSAGSLVVTGQYARRTPALSVRVLAGTPNSGSWEIPAIIMTVAPIVAPAFPTIAEASKKAATKAVTGIFNYVVAKIAGKKNETEMALGLADKALSEMGQTSRTAIQAMERIAANQRPAIKLFVSPVGDTCATARVGEMEHGALSIDKVMRDVIDSPSPMEIGPSSMVEIMISELDLKNRTCKFTTRDEDDPDHRFTGDILDPILSSPDNPYSKALSLQRWLHVVGKPQLRDGEMERLYISDASPPAPLSASQR
jgi:hypothetical protein